MTDTNANLRQSHAEILRKSEELLQPENLEKEKQKLRRQSFDRLSQSLNLTNLTMEEVEQSSNDELFDLIQQRSAKNQPQKKQNKNFLN